MPLPKALRRLTPDRLRHSRRPRALALGLGLIPPRTMHAAEEAALLTRLAGDARRVVEIGVYEGSSAVVLLRALRPGADLHLIDPFVDESGYALPSGAWSSPDAARRVVARAASRAAGGPPRVHWHVARSQDVGRTWAGPADLVFVDGDHSPAGVRGDWDAWREHVRPGGVMAFHDARDGRPGGCGSVGVTPVVDALFRGEDAVPGWAIVEEVASVVAVRREPAS